VGGSGVLDPPVACTSGIVVDVKGNIHPTNT